ncbi:MAG TPA: putative toxin-antitoxin system toxin component, PIN family [Cyclobacteriaceae bacterium]|mgnify:FL=1|nr:putative toxin-antitoxin system toxin component, PIN family [Cyclobacteriaceae bacterium]HRJ82054.1 putative toxin-antitoxin system toxin component, PIN family [Cyclobacteriaceae bacterium]
MPSLKPSKIILDTNIWISFLIGKELQDLKDLIVDEKVKVITTDQLINEIKLVTSRDKLKKYFNQDKVSELISLLDILADKVKIKKIDKICRDPKDDFLLALSKESRANYLITGDKDLLDIKVYGRTKIVTVRQFKEKIK